jgi:hypothetical protein
MSLESRDLSVDNTKKEGADFIPEEATATPEPDLTALRDAKCVPIARRIIKMLGNVETMPVNTKDVAELNATFVPLTSDVLGVLLEEDVKFDEVNYVMRLVLEAYDTLNNYLSQSLNKSMDKASGYFWGKEYTEVTIGDMDRMLKEAHKKYELDVPNL